MKPSMLNNTDRPPRLILGMSSREGAAVLALGLVILTVRLSLVVAYASSEPFWDEWDATIDLLLRKYSTHSLSFLDLFKTHNEHTIFFTRLVNLGALWLNHGQFDNLPVALFNQFLFAATWIFVTRILIVHGRKEAFAFPILFGLCGIIPLGAENVLTGFQNSFYFLIFGSALTIWLACKSRESSIGSWIGFVLAVFAVCLSMGSGFVAPVAAMMVCLVRARVEPLQRRDLVIKAAVCIAAAIFGFVLLARTGRLPSAHASTVDAIVRALSCLAWPYGRSAVLGFCLCIPFTLFSFHLIFRRPGAPAIDYFAFGLGLWVLAQVAAIAVSREADGASVSLRYFDVLMFWPIFSVYYLHRFIHFMNPDAATTGESSNDSPVASPGSASWRVVVRTPEILAAALIGCVAALTPQSIDFISVRGDQFAVQSRRVADYLRTGNTSALDAPDFLELPYPSAQRLQSLLDDPIVRNGMPVDVRTPLPLTTTSTQSGAAFVPHGEYMTTPRPEGLRDFGSYTAVGNTNTGQFQSGSMQTEYPFVVIGVAGYLPDTLLSLQLGCLPKSSCVAIDVAPTQAARENWKDLVVRVPEKNFVLYAQDDSPALWFAFTAPVEAGPLSALTIRAIAWALGAKPMLIAILGATIAWLLFFAGTGVRAGLLPKTTTNP